MNRDKYFFFKDQSLIFKSIKIRKKIIFFLDLSANTEKHVYYDMKNFIGTYGNCTNISKTKFFNGESKIRLKSKLKSLKDE